MNVGLRVAYNKYFKLKVLESDGQAYQDLFTKVMGYRHDPFKLIKPHGNIGDKKNDGYFSTGGSYYQVYAPEHHDKGNVSAALSKLDNDLRGLIANWSSIDPVREFRYVINDKFKGSYPEIAQALLGYKKEFALDRCEVFLAKDLVNEFDGLKEHWMNEIVGAPPTGVDLERIEHCAFHDIFAFLLGKSSKGRRAEKYVVPDFEEKLQFNKVGPAVAREISYNCLHFSAMDEFFDNNGDISKRDIKDAIVQIYERILGEPSDSEDIHPGDRIYYRMMEEMTNGSSVMATETAAGVVMSYFFESCDFMEEPAHD